MWRELVRAETVADGLHHGTKQYQAMTRLDFDADGLEEIEMTSPDFAALIKPSRGGTLEILDFRPSAVTLINSYSGAWRLIIRACTCDPIDRTRHVDP